MFKILSLRSYYEHTHPHINKKPLERAQKIVRREGML